MSDIVISVESLWKQYRYGTISHATLRKDIQSWWARVRGKEDPNLPLDMEQLTRNAERRTRNEEGEADDRFWALRDINFEVGRGEVLGIIGRNGAGKSTLLKIMSKVTTPTRGRIKIKGRVASLLEVGTGFHPELTGGENIYLNGAILGMTKDEIRRKFDEIVAFAEVEKFVDTPVKRYSSGMYVRLAFAVAAHLEPEILIVDEVLAVGDASFQKKCLGKMGDVAKEGRTVLFVSHNMAAVKILCSETLLLGEGRVMEYGTTARLVSQYLDSGSDKSGEKTWSDGLGDERLRFLRVRLLNSQGRVCATFPIDEDIVVECQFEVLKGIQGARVGFRLLTLDGTVVLTSEDCDFSDDLLEKMPGVYVTKTRLPSNLLNEGRYALSVGCHIPRVRTIFLDENCLGFAVVNSGVRGFIDDGRRGIIRPRLAWEYSIRPRTAEAEIGG